MLFFRTVVYMTPAFLFVKDRYTREAYEDAFDAVTFLNLWDELRARGCGRIEEFLKSQTTKPDRYDQLVRRADRRMMHSRASFRHTMKIMEDIAVHGWYAWKWDYIQTHRSDVMVAVRRFLSKCVECVSNPAYRACRRRLLREYRENDLSIKKN